jgi:predicted nucleotide-binding protein
VVHGHDDGAKHSVARFLEQLGIVPVILQEQINRGMTVIEKFEDLAGRAGFAVILITPDDMGHAAGKEQEKKNRPRQNVVLELGYFVGRLGRSKTLVLVKGEVEMPSDVLGLVYEPMDRTEGWKIRLARELKASGFEIDLNRAI